MTEPNSLPEASDYRPPSAPLLLAVPESRLHLGYVAIAGAVYGLLMRLAFGLVPFERLWPDGASGGQRAGGAMLVSFLFLVPLAIGALTVVLDVPARRNFGRSIWSPWLPMLLFLLTSALLMLEGSICILMASPIFFAMSSIGGVVAWAVVRTITPSPSMTSAFLALPLLTGAFEAARPVPDYFGQSRTAIHIAAPPERIWQLINDARDIRPEEMHEGLAWRIGVPYPQQAVTVATAQGRVRQLRWDKDVHFDEPILEWDEPRFIRWSYHFSPDSIPAGALDDHVNVGGRYFDLLETSYRLVPDGAGTRLEIDVSYRISTPFNFYAAWVGRVLVDDAAETILAFYKRRCETPLGAGA